VTISRIGEVELQATEGALILGVTFAAVSMIRLGHWGGLIAGVLILMSLMIHEVGHLAMAQCLGVRVKAIGLCLKGAYVCRSSSSEPLSELLIAASGPAANALLFLWLRDGNAVARWVAMLNLVLAASSLLPIGPSDGQRIASSWRTLRRASRID
jgi:Zn-dependent protease